MAQSPTRSPNPLLVRSAMPSGRRPERVVVGLPGVSTIGHGQSIPPLLISRQGRRMGRPTRVPIDRPNRISTILNTHLQRRPAQLWLRDRTRFEREFGSTALAIERLLADVAATHNVPFVGWTGGRDHPVTIQGIYEEIWAAGTASAVLECERVRE